MRSVEGTSVMVTGGGSGLGAAAASHLARRGARVTICGRRPEKVRSVAESIGAAAAWIEADVDDPDDRARIVGASLGHGGGIDVLVNNAGNRYAAPLEEIEESQVASMYQNNVVSPIMLSQLALPHLVERKGAVVFIGSVDVRRVLPPAAAYAPAKAAVHRLTGVLAVHPRRERRRGDQPRQLEPRPEFPRPAGQQGGPARPLLRLPVQHPQVPGFSGVLPDPPAADPDHMGQKRRDLRYRRRRGLQARPSGRRATPTGHRPFRARRRRRGDRWAYQAILGRESRRKTGCSGHSPQVRLIRKRYDR